MRSGKCVHTASLEIRIQESFPRKKCTKNISFHTNWYIAAQCCIELSTLDLLKQYCLCMMCLQVIFQEISTKSVTCGMCNILWLHEDVIKWKHFPRNWPFMRGIHRSPVNSPHKGQWRGALMFTLICARINGWVNTRESGDLRRYRPHYDVIVMDYTTVIWSEWASLFPLRNFFMGQNQNGHRGTLQLWLSCNNYKCLLNT